MITFRKIDYQRDVPEVVKLLRTSLSDRHTVESFKWKHCDNPFGLSIGYLAFHNQKLVGVRMFMCWEFESDKKRVRALRPVDSVTHEEYRGKGVFKRLTALILEHCSGKYQFIFNTPNRNSSPGNLKMGWQKYRSNASLKTGFFFPFRTSGDLRNIPVGKIAFSPLQEPRSGFGTVRSRAYFRWRYKDPDYRVALYGKDSDFTNAIIYKVERLKMMKTVIIYELMGAPGNYRPMVRRLLKKLGTGLVHYLEQDGTRLMPHLALSKQPPLVLYRDDAASVANELVFSLGDLEGRI